MKYIITLLLTLILTVGSANAEESPFDGRYNVKPLVYTECKAGQLFIIASSKYGIAIMQVFKDAGDMVPKPVECTCEDEK